MTRERCLREFAQIGFTHIEGFVGTSTKDGLFQELELGRISASEFIDEVLTHCEPQTTRERIVEIWNDFIDPIPAKRLDLLLELKSKYRILLLSNTNIIHWKTVCDRDFSRGGHTVDDYFERTFLSFVLHITKPDVAIFREMIAQSGILPEETLFIDDARANCDAAQTLGIRSFCAVGDNWMTP